MVWPKLKRLCPITWLILTEKLYEILRFLLGYRPQGVCALAKRLPFLRFSRQIAENKFQLNQPFSVT